jgi:hypothetical protein
MNCRVTVICRLAASFEIGAACAPLAVTNPKSCRETSGSGRGVIYKADFLSAEAFWRDKTGFLAGFLTFWKTYAHFSEFYEVKKYIVKS